MIEGYDDDDLEVLIFQSYISTWFPEFCIAELLCETTTQENHTLYFTICNGGVTVGLHEL